MLFQARIFDLIFWCYSESEFGFGFFPSIINFVPGSVVNWVGTHSGEPSEMGTVYPSRDLSKYGPFGGVLANHVRRLHCSFPSWARNPGPTRPHTRFQHSWHLRTVAQCLKTVKRVGFVRIHNWNIFDWWKLLRSAPGPEPGSNFGLIPDSNIPDTSELLPSV